MNDLTLSNSKNLTMSSREIAKLTKKEHSHVKRDIAQMILQLNYPDKKLKDCPVFNPPELEGHGITIGLFEHYGNVYDEFYLDHDYTTLLISGYDASVRLKIIKRWKELEQPQRQIPQTLSQALLLASQQAEQIEHQKEQLAIAAPKVEFVDRFVESTGNKTFREVAKMLKANEREFRAFLYETKVMYQLGGGWTAHSGHIDAGRFYVTGGEANGHAYTTCKFTPKGIEYIAGKWVAHKELSK